MTSAQRSETASCTFAQVVHAHLARLYNEAQHNAFCALRRTLQTTHVPEALAAILPQVSLIMSLPSPVKQASPLPAAA